MNDEDNDEERKMLRVKRSVLLKIIIIAFALTVCKIIICQMRCQSTDLSTMCLQLPNCRCRAQFKFSLPRTIYNCSRARFLPTQYVKCTIIASRNPFSARELRRPDDFRSLHEPYIIFLAIFLSRQRYANIGLRQRCKNR